MMLQIQCFQTFTVRLDQQTVAFRSTKGRALLAYLAVEQQVHQRTTIAGLFWPDQPETRARRNLTQTLLEVRKAIGDGNATAPYFHITTSTIAFNRQSQHFLDIDAFTTALASRDYAQASALYCGPFLADLTVTDSDLLDVWLETTREQLQQQAIDAFQTLATEQEEANQLEEALQTTRRLLALVPWLEEAHCQLMRLLARTGQRSTALAQYDIVTALLLDELGVVPSPETDTLYDQIVSGKLSPETPTSSPPMALRQLNANDAPFQALALSPHFVGRQATLQRIRHHLMAPGLQLCAIVGMGGAGKTTLATQIAHSARGDFHDGVLWASLQSGSLLDILASWANAYGYDFSQLSDLESRAAAVRGLLAERQTLLVIDNVQQARDVEMLLPNGGECAVLLTTRDLDVATALNAQIEVVDELTTAEAYELLNQILGTARIQAEEAAAAEICTLCGNLPLAVEIVAQRLRSRPRMKLTQMVARLGDHQQRLDLEISDRAVRASFAVSWDALDSELQHTFSTLALFGNQSFRAEALTYIVEGDPFEIEDQLYTLETLSLVRGVDHDRYQLHPLLADFAQEKFTYQQESSQRYIDYFYNYAATHSQEPETIWLEWQNIRAAMEKAFYHEYWQQVIAFSVLLYPLWFSQARYSDARHGFTMAQQAAQASEDCMAEATVLLRRGEACLEQNDYEEAQHCLRASIAIYQAENEETGIADVSYQLARIAIEQSNYEQAESYLTKSLAIRQQLGQSVGIAMVRYRQAMLHYTLDQYNRAMELAQEALTILNSPSNETVITAKEDPTPIQDAPNLERFNLYQQKIPVLRLLAQIHLYLDELEMAKEYGEEAKHLSEAIANTDELATTLYVLTGVFRFRHEYDIARSYANQGLVLFRRAGMRRLEAMLLYQLSRIDQATADLQSALQSALDSIQIFRVLQDQLGIANALLQLGDLYLAMGQRTQAILVWKDGKSIGTALGNDGLCQEFRKRLESHDRPPNVPTA